MSTTIIIKQHSFFHLDTELEREEILEEKEEGRRPKSSRGNFGGGGESFGATIGGGVYIVSITRDTI